MPARSIYSVIAGVFTFLALSVSAFAAPPVESSISGFVQDSITKETIVGATVRIKGSKRGSYTNKNGYFHLPNLADSTITLIISAVGYTRKELLVNISKREAVQIRIELQATSITKDVVTVEAERENEQRNISVSRVNIPMQQISQMRIGGEADIFRALQMLPGVLTSSQISSGLYIRGGSPDQNLVLLDGMTVYNPTHLFGFISAFNVDAVKDVELLKGGFPAEFGGRMSAVLNITQKDGNRDHIEGLVALGFISSRASLQGPLGNGSWFIGARRTYLDLLLGLLPEDPKNPFPSFNFYDVNAKITQNFGDNDKVSLSGFLTRDVLGLVQPGLNFEVGIGNRATSIRWLHNFKSDLFLTTTVSASRYDNGFGGNNSGFIFAINNSITDYTFKTGLEWFFNEDITFRFGYEGTLFNFTYDQKTGSENDATGGTAASRINVWDNIHSGYGQINAMVTEDISVQAGFRVNYWNESRLTTFDPRFAVRFQLYENVAVKASWGIFNQYLRLASAPDFTFFDTWLPTDQTVPPGSSNHYILALETTPAEGFNVNVDVYYKTLKNINELRQGQSFSTTVANVFYIGNGEAYGLEFFVQKKIGRLSGWVGYGLGWVNATFDSINFGREFRPKYDRRNDVKINTLFELDERWDIGASFVFQSGQSYTGATSQLSGRMPGWEGGIIMVQPSQRWGLRLPNSHQLNLNVNYKTTIGELPLRIFLDIYNVYSRRDIWFRYYDTTEPIPTVTDIRLLPIIPTISAELKF
ncbi:MAG: TonB-dependent receptor [Ignavibacteria bacterium]|nr:TonB-dependent receptor [Ignavibacteria bacterium]